MLIYILLVSIIVLIDFSGIVLDDFLLSLLYVKDAKNVVENLGNTASLSSDELSKRAEEHIFQE